MTPLLKHDVAQCSTGPWLLQALLVSKDSRNSWIMLLLSNSFIIAIFWSKNRSNKGKCPTNAEDKYLSKLIILLKQTLAL